VVAPRWIVRRPAGTAPGNLCNEPVEMRSIPREAVRCITSIRDPPIPGPRNEYIARQDPASSDAVLGADVSGRSAPADEHPQARIPDDYHGRFPTP
jgi:hypothetical protein